MILLVVCSLAALALVILGIAAMASPVGMAHFYGLPVADDPGLGFVRATGSRDLIIGLVLAAAIWYQYWPLIDVLLAAGILLSLGDFWIAYHAAGKRFHRGHSVHASGIVAFVLVLLMALFAIGR
jgi:Domain of unknown function (DUF4267)